MSASSAAPLPAEEAQNGDQSSGDGQNDRGRESNQATRTLVWLIDGVAAMRAVLSVLRYLPPSFFYTQPSP